MCFPSLEGSPGRRHHRGGDNAMEIGTREGRRSYEQDMGKRGSWEGSVRWHPLCEAGFNEKWSSLLKEKKKSIINAYMIE